MDTEARAKHILSTLVNTLSSDEQHEIEPLLKIKILKTY